jgi:hypothetical protein
MSRADFHKKAKGGARRNKARGVSGKETEEKINALLEAF